MPQVSARRITKFLLLPEKEQLDVRRTDGRHGVVVANATFEWEAAADPDDVEGDSGSGSAATNAEAAKGAPSLPAFKLANVNLEVPHGKLAVILGRVRHVVTRRAWACTHTHAPAVPGGVALPSQVGSGKTSLCSAVLSEMRKTTGTVAVYGRCAYVPQQAFVLNDTIRVGASLCGARCAARWLG